MILTLNNVSHAPATLSSMVLANNVFAQQIFLTMMVLNAFHAVQVLSGTPPLEVATHAQTPSTTTLPPKDASALRQPLTSKIIDVFPALPIKSLIPLQINVNTAQAILLSSLITNALLVLPIPTMTLTLDNASHAPAILHSILIQDSALAQPTCHITTAHYALTAAKVQPGTLTP